MLSSAAHDYSRSLVSLFTFNILLSTLSTLVPYAFWRHRMACSPIGTAVIASLAFLYSLWAIGGAGIDAVYWGFLLLLAGLPVYIWVVRS